MDKTSSGLNAAAAYDLACRYNSLFQYNPAAVAACAAAYGAGMFQTNAPNPQNSVSSPTNSSASSNMNGANTSTSSSPKQSIKQSIELAAKTEKVADNLFESVTENDDSLHESEDAGYPIDEDDQNNSLTTHLKELQEAEEVLKPQKRARSDSVSSLNSTTSSLSSFNENQQENDDLIQQNLISTANKAIESCFDKQLDQQEEYEDELEHEKSPNKKICSSSGQTSLGSILDSLTARCSSSSGSSNSSCSSNAAKLIKKVDDLKSKLTNAELDMFKTELISSVNQAIQNTFKKFFEKPNEPVVKSVIKTEKESMPISLKRTTPPIRPTLAPPTSFNVSNLLDTNKKSSNVRVGDISKRKLSSSSKSPMEPAKPFKYSAQSLINHQHSPSFSTSSTSSSSSHKQSVVNQFYSAALSHLQNPMSGHHKSPPVNCGNPSFNMNNLVNSGPSFTGPAHFLTSPSLMTSSATPPGNSSMFAHHHHPHHQHHSQHHQFLLAAAAASSSSSSSNPASAHSANYFNMAAAANRLFTPYLLEHHHQQQQQQSSQTSMVSVPSSSKPSRPAHHAVNFPNPQAPSLFHVPGKRRRTKVTDTRLSPRNGHSLIRPGGPGLNNAVKQVDMKKMSGGQSPSHSCNDNDDQENFNQDYEDHPNNKYMESVSVLTEHLLGCLVKFFFLIWKESRRIDGSSEWPQHVDSSSERRGRRLDVQLHWERRRSVGHHAQRLLQLDKHVQQPERVHHQPVQQQRHEWHWTRHIVLLIKRIHRLSDIL